MLINYPFSNLINLGNLLGKWILNYLKDKINFVKYGSVNDFWIRDFFVDQIVSLLISWHFFINGYCSTFTFYSFSGWVWFKIVTNRFWIRLYFIMFVHSVIIGSVFFLFYRLYNDVNIVLNMDDIFLVVSTTFVLVCIYKFSRCFGSLD